MRACVRACVWLWVYECARVCGYGGPWMSFWDGERRGWREQGGEVKREEGQSGPHDMCRSMGKGGAHAHIADVIDATFLLIADRSDSNLQKVQVPLPFEKPSALNQEAGPCTR